MKKAPFLHPVFLLKLINPLAFEYRVPVQVPVSIILFHPLLRLGADYFYTYA